jgi:hypothetical protein
MKSHPFFIQFVAIYSFRAEIIIFRSSLPREIAQSGKPQNRSKKCLAEKMASRRMPDPQMLQTLLPARKGLQVTAGGARTLEMVEFEAVFLPVGEADEMLVAVPGILEPVAFQLGFGGEVGLAVTALWGGGSI